MTPAQAVEVAEALTVAAENADFALAARLRNPVTKRPRARGLLENDEPKIMRTKPPQISSGWTPGESVGHSMCVALGPTAGQATELHLKPETLRWTRSHVEHKGDTDIFPVPFEYQSIWAEWSTLMPTLCNTDLVTWRSGESRRCLTPKSRHGFRLGAQLDPIDLLLFSGLVYEIAKDLESARTSRDLNSVFGHRIKRNTDGQLYDPACNFDSFQDQLRAECAAHPSSWVIATDIADFYSRIYHHRLENALKDATSSTQHVEAIMNFLGQWTFSVSYGIPVGPAATRILAEITISDVDSALAAEGIRFCRFSDDYRLFAPSEREARRALATLANVLCENHGMTLNDQKTYVVSASDFARYRLNGFGHSSSASLATRIRGILRAHNVDDDPYQDLSIEDLPEEVVAALDDLDLNAAIVEQVQDPRPMDNIAASTALRRLAQLRDARSLDAVLDNIDRLAPVLKQVTYYLAKVVTSEERGRIGRRLLDVIRSGVNSHLEFQRVWLLSLFADDDSWNCRDELVPLLDQVHDEVSRPMLLLALGVAGHSQWFRSNRRGVLSMSGWERRAFIRGGALAMGSDEYKHWIGSVLPSLHPLDAAVARDSRRRITASP